MTGRIISIEGINGMGKTFIMNRLIDDYKDIDEIVFVNEVFTEKLKGLHDKIFSALFHTEDVFFNMGMPYTETLLVLALGTYKHETMITDLVNTGKIVIKDRDIDTAAVYQGILISKKTKEDPLKCAINVYEIASRFRLLPKVSFLLTGNTAKAIKRAETRNGKSYTLEQIELLHDIAELYQLYAKQFKERIEILDLDETHSESIYCKIKNKINQELDELKAERLQNKNIVI